jgi:hypothetical protein
MTQYLIIKYNHHHTKEVLFLSGGNSYFTICFFFIFDQMVDLVVHICVSHVKCLQSNCKNMKKTHVILITILNICIVNIRSTQDEIHCLFCCSTKFLWVVIFASFLLFMIVRSKYETINGNVSNDSGYNKQKGPNKPFLHNKLQGLIMNCAYFCLVGMPDKR